MYSVDEASTVCRSTTGGVLDGFIFIVDDLLRHICDFLNILELKQIYDNLADARDGHVKDTT